MSRRRIEGAAVPILLFALAFLSPLGTSTYISGTEDYAQRLVAPVWEFFLSGPIAGAFTFNISMLYFRAPDLVSELLLSIVASLYYLGLGNRRVVVLSGLVSPLVYMRGYLHPLEGLELWMHYPIPVMFVIVVVMTLVYPAHRAADRLKSDSVETKVTEVESTRE